MPVDSPFAGKISISTFAGNTAYVSYTSPDKIRALLFEASVAKTLNAVAIQTETSLQIYSLQEDWLVLKVSNSSSEEGQARCMASLLDRISRDVANFSGIFVYESELNASKSFFFNSSCISYYSTISTGIFGGGHQHCHICLNCSGQANDTDRDLCVQTDIEDMPGQNNPHDLAFCAQVQQNGM